MRTDDLYRLAWLFYLLLAVGGALWVGLRGELEPSLLADPMSWGLDVLLGIACGAGLLALWQLGRRYLPYARLLEVSLAALLSGVDRGQALALALLSGFAEELFFRGAMQGAWGLLPATLLFALLHSGPGPAFRLWTVFAAVAGLAFGLLVLWRGTLLAAMVGHFVVNAVNLSRLAAAGTPRTPPS